VLAPGGRFLLVERKLRRRKGHGLHPDIAREVATELRSAALATAVIEDMHVGRKVYLTIAASAPVR
jgi:hypothetical protein